MHGDSDLATLVAGMEPSLQSGRFVFTTVGRPPPDIEAVARVREAEGTTLVVEQQVADERGLAYDFVAAMITLGVESALDAVGLTATVASALADAGIACNVIAGYHHDHLFVPLDRAGEAMAVLTGLSGARALEQVPGGALMKPEESLGAGELVVRRYRPEDAPGLHEAIIESLEELRPWMPWAAPEPLAVSDREALITGTFDAGWREGSEFVYGLFMGDKVVGGCGLHKRIAPDGLEIGYWVRTGHTGQGLATIAARTLSEAAFRLDHITHVEIHHDKANAASRRVAEKLGFELVGEVETRISSPGESGVACLWRLERPSAGAGDRRG